jgi:hydroxymethylpyrimidine/phosphomethylpyrimidine kinase
LGERIKNQQELPQAAQKLSLNGKISVMLKAGHLTDNELVDVFYNAEDGSMLALKSKRVSTKNTHGTGCTLSSAIASFLALGLPLHDAVKKAKEYIDKAIVSGAGYSLGKGHGPVHHFFKYWK